MSYRHCCRPFDGLSLTFALCAGLAALPVQADEILTQGNFEAGSLSGWQAVSQLNVADTIGADRFYVVAPGSLTPAVGGISFSTAANSPGGGSFYAVTASDNPGSHALLQNFTVPTASTKLILSFQMFVNDQSGAGPYVDPSGLDYTTGGTFANNQHARVDILRAGSADLSTTLADVVANLYLGVDNPGTATPNPYGSYTFALTSALTPGSSYRLRFAEVDNLGSINLGIDNVSLAATTPEPGALTLSAALSVIGILCFRRRDRIPPHQLTSQS